MPGCAFCLSFSHFLVGRSLSLLNARDLEIEAPRAGRHNVYHWEEADCSRIHSLPLSQPPRHHQKLNQESLSNSVSLYLSFFHSIYSSCSWEKIGAPSREIWRKGISEVRQRNLEPGTHTLSVSLLSIMLRLCSMLEVRNFKVPLLQYEKREVITKYDLRCNLKAVHLLKSETFCFIAPSWRQVRVSFSLRNGKITLELPRWEYFWSYWEAATGFD